MAIDAAGRGGSITQRLLSFARRGELRTEALPTAELLGNIREVLAHTLGTTIVRAEHVPPAFPPLIADRGQLETALVNLGTNARDAMPEAARSPWQLRPWTSPLTSIVPSGWRRAPIYD